MEVIFFSQLCTDVPHILQDYIPNPGAIMPVRQLWLTLSPPSQNGHHFAEDVSKCIFVNEKFCLLIKISLKFVPKGPIDNNPALI